MADVIIVYDSKTGATERAAGLVLDGVKASGADGAMKKVQDVTEKDLQDAKAVILGSPSVNDNISGPMREFIDGKMKKVKMFGKAGAAFGTYKWNTENLRRLETAMQYADINLVTPGVNAHHRHTDQSDRELKALGEAVGREALKLRT